MQKGADRNLLVRLANAFKEGPIHWIGLGIIIIAGSFLRFYRISTQSFWDDEVSTFMVSALNPKMIWTLIGNVDSNPPLYYFVLHFWMKLGEGEFALRSLSALLGTLSIYLTYKLGNILSGRCAGLFAAGLFAVSPLGIYCAQETRYNMLLTTLTLLSVIFFTRLMQSGNRRYAVGLALCVAAMIYTHYYSFFVIAALCMYLFACAFTSYKRNKESLNNIKSTFVSLFIALVLFLPFMKYFIQQLSEGILGRDMVPAGSVLKKILIYLFAGHSPAYLPTISNRFAEIFEKFPGFHEWILIVAVAPIYVVIVYGLFGKKVNNRKLLLFLLTIPIGLVLLFSLRLPLFDPRYVMLFVPLVCIAAGAGLAKVFGFRPVIGLFLVIYMILLSAISLKDYYFQPKYWRQDWRGIALELQNEATEKDAICFYNYYSSLAFQYYYKGKAPIVYLFEFDDRHEPNENQHQKLKRLFQEITKRDSTMWLIDYHGYHDDPEDITRKELTKQGYSKLFQKCRMTGLYRFCVERFSKNEEDVFTAYSSSIDFSAKEPNELQLVEGFYPTKGAWRWIGKQARVLMPVPEGPYNVSASFFVNYEYLGQSPFHVILRVDGETVGKVRVNDSNVFVVESSTLLSDKNKMITVEIESEKTFIPDTVLNDGDKTRKSLLVNRIEVVGTPQERIGE